MLVKWNSVLLQLSLSWVFQKWAFPSMKMVQCLKLLSTAWNRQFELMKRRSRMLQLSLVLLLMEQGREFVLK